MQNENTANTLAQSVTARLARRGCLLKVFMSDNARPYSIRMMALGSDRLLLLILLNLEQTLHEIQRIIHQVM